MLSVCPSTTTATEPSSFKVWMASLSTGTASGRMVYLLKSKCTLRSTIFFLTGGGGGAAAAGGGGGGGGGGGACAKEYFRLTPAVAYCMSSPIRSLAVCVSPRFVGRGDM